MSTNRAARAQRSIGNRGRFGKTRGPESLEQRTLLNAAPVAGNDAYEVTEDTQLVVGNSLPPGVTPLVWPVNGHAYAQIDTPLTWSEAEAAAKTWRYHGVSGQLVSINTAAENTFLQQNVIHPAGNGNKHIGLTDRAQEGQFKWLTGEPLTFSNWENGEPNNAGDEDAVEMYASGRWNDARTTVVNPAYLVEFATPFQGGVLENDTDADSDPLTAVLVDGPQHGTLELVADGTFTYRPDQDYVGEDSFTYRASDGTAESDVATVSITVNRFNSAPNAMSDQYVLNANTALEKTAVRGVLKNDVDPQSDALTAVLVDGPRHGTLQLAADGAFSYTPDVNYSGIDRFTYRADDGDLQSNIAMVTLRIAADPDGPLARDDAYSLNEDTTLVIDATPAITVRQMSLEWHDIEFDPTGQLLYASQGDYLQTIDPYTGELGPTYFVGDSPTRMAISEDGHFIYMSVNDGRWIKRFDTWTSTVDLHWQIGDFSQFGLALDDLLAVPGDPRAVAVHQIYPCCSPRAGGIVIFKDGVALPDDTAGGLGTSPGGDQITFADPGLIIGYNNLSSDFSISQMVVDAQGVRRTRVREGLIVGNNSMVGGGGKFYDQGGNAFDAYELTRLGQLGVGGNIVPDPQNNRVLVLNGSGNQTRLYWFDDETFQQLGMINIPGIEGSVGGLQKLGRGDVMFGTSGGKVVIVHSDRLGGFEPSGVMTNDVDPNGDELTPTLIEDVQHGTLTWNGDGTFEYEPEANFSGMDEFRYRVSDGVNESNVAIVTLTVNSVNDAPVAQDDAYRLMFGGALVVAAEDGVLANDSDADNQAITASVYRNPSLGTLQFGANGAFRYTPGPNFVEGDSFQYRAYDGTAYSAPVTVEIIYDVPRVIVGEHTLLANTPNQTIQILVTGGQEVAGMNLFMQVGDGGPERTQFDLPAGLDGPAITAIDIRTGTVFASVPDAELIDLAIPQVASAQISIAETNGTIAADGLLATITLDTTGLFGGTWDLLLNQVLAGFGGGPFATDFAGLPGIIENGQLVIKEATIAARDVFYAGSAYGDEPASDKQALLPGQTATFANYSSYVGGINGVAVDIANALGTVALSDFAFYVGNSNDTSTWQPAPAPTFELLPGAGNDGADRAVLRWEDGSITGQWLMVRVKSTINTGLAAEDVFYFGNAVGESGDSAANALVNATDVIGTRNNTHGPLNPAAIDDRFDFNRDRLVNATDLVIARDHATSPLSALRLITPNGALPSAPPLRHGPSPRSRLESLRDGSVTARKFDSMRHDAALAALDAVFRTHDFSAPASLSRKLRGKPV